MATRFCFDDDEDDVRLSVTARDDLFYMSGPEFDDVPFAWAQLAELEWLVGKLRKYANENGIISELKA